jgi:hypothetical protein
MPTPNYSLNWSDVTLKPPLVVAGDHIDISSTALSLDGESSIDWGEGLNEDWLKLIERFSSSDFAPLTPTHGQLWFNSTYKELSVWWADYGVWKIINENRIDGVYPSEIYANPDVGDLWYDTINDVLKVFSNNGIWVSVCFACSESVVSTMTPVPTNLTTHPPTPTPV